MRAGVWGGAGVFLVVTATGAEVLAPCSKGTIDEPLALSHRSFIVAGTRRGTWKGTHGGLTGPLQPAMYSAEMGPYDRTLTLRTTTADGTQLEPLKLEYGKRIEGSTCD
jgi:hypothetical protein